MGFSGSASTSPVHLPRLSGVRNQTFDDEYPSRSLSPLALLRPGISGIKRPDGYSERQ
jgi:hypothetical protein